MNERFEYEDKVLKQNGWIQNADFSWTDSEGNSHSCHQAYDHFTSAVIHKNGWKPITEIHRIGKREWHKVNVWARYQSPHTKRIYNFLEVQDFMENNFIENAEVCSECTIENNKLINDFDGDTIYTWFYLDGDKSVYELWNPGKILVSDVSGENYLDEINLAIQVLDQLWYNTHEFIVNHSYEFFEGLRGPPYREIGEKFDLVLGDRVVYPTLKRRGT